MQLNDPVLVGTTSVNSKLAELVKASTGSNLFQHCDKNRYGPNARDLVVLSNGPNDPNVLLSTCDPVLGQYHLTFAVFLAELTYIRLIEYGRIKVSRVPTTFDGISLVTLNGDLLDFKHFVIDCTNMDNSFLQLVAKKVYAAICSCGFRALWQDYTIVARDNYLKIEEK